MQNFEKAQSILRLFLNPDMYSDTGLFDELSSAVSLASSDSAVLNERQLTILLELTMSAKKAIHEAMTADSEVENNELAMYESNIVAFLAYLCLGHQGDIAQVQ
jgi:hypothetical protein